MSFGKIVTLSMLVAFSAGAGYSALSDGHGLPELVKVLQETSNSTRIETFSPSVQFVKTTPERTKVSEFRPYSLCSGSTRYHCVVDGDTLWHQGTKIRVADIDTPEVGEPKCSSEAALGAKATKRMLQLLNAGPFEIQAWPGRDEDRYGRKLRILVRGGRSLGDILVTEGLARTWTGRRQPWC